MLAPLSLSWATSGQNTSVDLPPTDNNLALKYYESSIYETRNSLRIVILMLACLAVVIFILALLVNRILALDMILVFQFTYCGVSLLTDMEALM